MKPCSNPLCTNQVEDTDKFCGVCGTYVGSDITQNGTQCVNCGRPLQLRQNVCLHCGTDITTIKGRLADPQANIPTMPSQISPPLKIAHLTEKERAVLEKTAITNNNVYVPQMRRLINFSLSPNHIEAGIGLLQPERDIADFTLQAVFESKTSMGGQIMFRLDKKTGLGYRFFFSTLITQWLVESLCTRLQLTNEILPFFEGISSGVRDVLALGYIASQHNRIVIAIVAQKATLDFYADFNLLARIENATSLHGRLGIGDVDLALRSEAISDLKVWIP